MDGSDKIKLKNSVEEICGQLAIIDSANDQIKSIVDNVKEYVDIKPADIKKIAKIRYKNNLEQARAEAEELFDIFDELFPSTS